MGISARETTRERFSQDKICDEYLNIYMKLLNTSY